MEKLIEFEKQNNETQYGWGTEDNAKKLLKISNEKNGWLEGYHFNVIEKLPESKNKNIVFNISDEITETGE